MRNDNIELDSSRSRVYSIGEYSSLDKTPRSIIRRGCGIRPVFPSCSPVAAAAATVTYVLYVATYIPHGSFNLSIRRKVNDFVEPNGHNI